MSNSTLYPGKPSTSRQSRFALGLKTLATLALPFFMLSQASGQSADLDQGENGSATSPKTIFWQNGNLGPSGAHFAEGYSIAYRMRIASLVGNSSTVHKLVIEWDTKDQNGHALDYITHYNNMDNPVGSHQANYSHGPEAVNPTTGTAFSGTPSLFQIPTPSSTGAEVTGMPAQSFTDLPGSSRTNNADATKMAIWGGSITKLTYLREDNQDATTASTKTQLEIQFTSSDGKTALIAWGGHIAAEYDWGKGRGASKVNGSPYHMRLISIDGKGGNQDRSLKASAVLVPTQGCTLSDALTACEGSSAGLTYSYTGSTTGITNYSWTLTPGATNAVISGGTTTTTLSGASVTSISIVPATNTTFAPGSFSVSLTVTNLGGAGTPCTQSGTINGRPTAPTTAVVTPLCTDATMTVEVTIPSGQTTGTVTVKQATGGASPITKNVSDAVSGKLTFTGLKFGYGYSTTFTDANGCTSLADECGITGGLQTRVNNQQPAVTDQEIVLKKTRLPKVLAAPNPFSDRIRFTLQSEVSGQGTLELYNTLGQKVKTIFQGQVTAGQVQTIEYSVPGAQRSSLIYVFRVGSESTSGKLIGLKQ